MKINPLWSVCLLCRFLLALLAKKIGNKNKTYKYGFTILFLFIGLPFIPKGIYGSNDEVQIAKVFWHEAPNNARYIIHTSSILRLCRKKS